MTAGMDQSVRLRADGITWRIVGGEIIGLDLHSSVYFTTNRTGALLWSLLVDGSTVGGLQRKLVDAFGLADDVAARDVVEFLRPLNDAGLLDARVAL